MPWSLPRRSHSEDCFSQRASLPVTHVAWAPDVSDGRKLGGKLGARMESMPALHGGFEPPVALGKERSALGQSALRIRTSATRWLPADEAGGVPVTPSMAGAEAGREGRSPGGLHRGGSTLVRGGSSFWPLPSIPDTPLSRTPLYPATPSRRNWVPGRHSMDDGNIGAFNRAGLLGLLGPQGSQLARADDDAPDQVRSLSACLASRHVIFFYIVKNFLKGK